jgi:hypothetical protein
LRYWRLMHIVCYNNINHSSLYVNPSTPSLLNVLESNTTGASTSCTKVRLLLLLLWRYQHRWEPSATSAVTLIFLVLLGVHLATFDRSILSLLRWYVQSHPLLSLSWRRVCLGLLLLTVSLYHNNVGWSIWGGSIEAVTCLLLDQASAKFWGSTTPTTSSATYQQVVWNGSFQGGPNSSYMAQQGKLASWTMLC